jgi:hypothetical protein
MRRALKNDGKVLMWLPDFKRRVWRVPPTRKELRKFLRDAKKVPLGIAVFPPFT